MSRFRGTVGEMQWRLQLNLCSVLLVFFSILPRYGVAWNISGHMLHGAITYQILRTESPSTSDAVRRTLENHPWYESRWRSQIEELPASDRDETLFMLAARWADDIRTKDRAQHRGPWHYINFPFKPEGQPKSVRTKPPEQANILTALTENERIAKSDKATPTERAIALAWLFHLVGDVHQPLHTVQLFTVDYPNGDRGGNEICVRPAPNRKAIDLHRLWDGVITSSSNASRLRNEATALRNRPEFALEWLQELVNVDFEAWAKEGFEIARKIVYMNGAAPGTPKGSRKDCSEVESGVLPSGYAQNARRIADRRMMLAGYRLAGLLDRVVTK